MDPASLQVSDSSSNLMVNQSDGDQERERRWDLQDAAELCLKVSPQQGELGRLILNYYLWSRHRKILG